jgi:hypothetical protein
MLNPNLLAALTPIYQATKSGSHGWASPKNPAVKALESQGYVVSDPKTVNPADGAHIAYRSTDKAVGEFPAEAPASGAVAGADGAQAPAASLPGNDADAPATATTEAASKPAGAKRGPRPNTPAPRVEYSGFRMALPATVAAEVKRGPRDKYGFAKLQAPVMGEDGVTPQYDSFFVAANSHLTNPAKQLGGNVNKANKKFGPGTPEGGTEGRQFKIMAVETDPEFNVAGARIFRVK